MNAWLTAAIAAPLIALVSLLACWLMRDNVWARVSVLRAGTLALVALPLLALVPWEWRVPVVELSGRRIALTESFRIDRLAAPVRSSRVDPTSSAPAARSPSAFVGAETSAATSPYTILAVVWLLGTLAVLVHLLAGLVRLERYARTGQAVASRWHDFARTKLPARRPARLRMVRGGPFPMAVCWGVRRTTILLPSHSDAWSDADMQTVLLHELAHARRRDTAYLMLARVAVALYWYNPLIWRVQTLLGRDTEELCDQLVLRDGVPPARYAHVLLDAACAARKHRYGAVPALARANFLERRIERVLAGTRAPGHRLTGFAGVLVVLATTFAAAFAAPVDSTITAGGTATNVEQDDIVSALIRALSDPAAEVRRSAVNSLRDIGDPRGIEALRRVLDDADPSVRRAAEAVLGLRPARPNLPLPESEAARPAPAVVLDSLASQLNDADYRVRLRAAHALGNVGDERVTGGLTARLADRHAQVRAAAAAALGNIADTRATPALVRAWPDPDDHVRASIASALGALRDLRGAHVLIAALTDAAAHVRSTAAEALGKLGRPPAVPAQAAGAQVIAEEPVQAVAAHAKVESPAVCASEERTDMGLVTAIETLLREPDAERRRGAARALGEFAAADLNAPLPAGVKSPHHALEAALSDPAMPVRIAAACSLARVGDARALAMLELRTRVREPIELRQAAGWAIHRIQN